jgi:hypothetical protein
VFDSKQGILGFFFFLKRFLMESSSEFALLILEMSSNEMHQTVEQLINRAPASTFARKKGQT